MMLQLHSLNQVYRLVLGTACLLSLWHATPIAHALSGADTVSRARVGVGSGPSLGTEFGIFEDLSIGLGVSSPVIFNGGFNTLQYSTFLNYQVLNQNGFYISGILGVYGNYNPMNPQESSYAGLQGGAAFAYDLNRFLTLRLNIVPGMALHIPPSGWTFLPPLGGIALAWRPQLNTELSVGFNGNGDLLEAYWLF